MADLGSEVRALRDRAWAEVVATPAYRAYSALKAAAEAFPADGNDAALRNSGSGIVRASSETKRISQADAAEKALIKEGEPLPVFPLMQRAMVEGAAIGGTDPLANFRSALSKDDRFKSFMQNGAYLWWFRDKPLPDGWNTRAGLPLDDKPAPVPEPSDQEGGDGHGPATT